MSNRKRILVSTILIMAGGMFCAAAVTIAILYNSELDGQRNHLMETARAQAQFMEAVARFDAIYSRHDYPGGARAATLSQIAAAHEHRRGFGETGELVVAQREGDQIAFLFPYRHGDGSDPDPIPWRSELAEPMRRGLSGQDGTLIGLDYRGELVLAAYHPVALLNLAVVAKADMAEIRAPFMMAALIAGGVTVLLVVIGVGLTLRVTGPLVQRLQESEERTRAIVETAADGIVTINDHGIIESFNRAAEQIFGYAAQEVIGQNVKTLMPPAYRDQHEGYLAKYLSTGQKKVIGIGQQVTGQREDGTLFPMDLMVSEVPLGKRRLFTGIVRDLTERRRAEEEVRAAQEALLAQQRQEKEHVATELEKVRGELVTRTRLASVGQVAASIAHELRNPLGAARNAAYYLKRYTTRPEPDLIEHLDIIESEIGVADQIITDLTNMTRSRPLVRHGLGFGQMVEEVLQRANLPDGIRCQVTLDPDPLTVFADSGQLRQVIGNLVTNAAQAIEGTGEIVIDAKQEGACCEIMVRDNGAGVAVEHRDSLFEPLFTTKAKGTGLGLTICREIIERHGGTIDLVDQDHPGAAFRIRLPRQTMTEAQ